MRRTQQRPQSVYKYICLPSTPGILPYPGSHAFVYFFLNPLAFTQAWAVSLSVPPPPFYLPVTPLPFTFTRSCALYRLVDLVVRRPPRERKIPGANPACGGIFSRSSHTSDLKIGTPVATLPDAWHYRVSTGTGRPGVSIL